MRIKRILILSLFCAFSFSIFAFFGCSGNSATDTQLPHVHNYGEWQVISEANFEHDGEEERFCKDCGEKDSRVISKKTERSFSISYELNGGEISAEKLAEAPAEYKNTDKDLYVSIKPYKKRFVFKGWAIADEKPMKSYVIKSGSEGDITLIAHYAEDSTIYYDGGEVDVLPDVISGYIEADNKAEYLQRNSGVGGDDVKSVAVRWAKTGSAYYNFELASDENYENIVYKKEETEGWSIDLFNLIPDVYYYRVTDRAGETVKEDSFKIADKVRTIYCGNIKNMRDMGGRNTAEGMIRYGLIYRSPEIFGADKVAKKTLAEDLGIKTEIDLRFESNTDTISDKITKYKLGVLQWDYILPRLNVSRPSDAAAIGNLKEIFRLFGDIKNYPIVFHCSAGADRTGTIGFLLNGLLGASYEDLAEDFEMTSFYFEKRWRSGIIKKDGEYAFDQSGVMQDDEGNLVAFDRAYRHIMSEYKTESGTLSDAIANYLKTEIGLTDFDIYSVKHIMLGLPGHMFGEWTVHNQGSCKANGEMRRYCACGLYETKEIVTIGTHVYGEWQVVTEPTVEHNGLRKRYCACGDEQSEVIPKYVKTVFDFNDADINAEVNTAAVNKYKASRVNDLSVVPDGYRGGVYSRTDGYIVCVGIGLSKEYKIEDLAEMKIRLRVDCSGKMSKGNVRIYDNTENRIYADKNFDNDLGGVYNKWTEIDLLPLLKESVKMTDTLVKDGKLQNFTLVIRTGTQATVYFDNVTVVGK